MLTRIPKGTKDILPGESAKWQALEAVMRDKARLCGYREVRTPIFEHTELFSRAAGESSDVVRKEMYTFKDKGDRSITLRPEGTAGAVRAFLESGLYAQALPLKMYYLDSAMFRYEAPQSGRLREFHQFGLECFGAAAPSCDAEMILFVCELLESVGIGNLTVRINSIGCPNCRPAYQQAFSAYLNSKLDKLCKDCNERAKINPMRALDCKVPACKAELVDAPVMVDCLCDECREHFDKVKALLDAAGVQYIVDTRIVRGLDYYTKTVFEVTTETENGELTVCAGGRYDGLVGEIGDVQIPAVGFGMGMERVLMLLNDENSRLQVESDAPEVFVASLNRSLDQNAFLLMRAFRTEGLRADMDHQGRSLKAQFKYADKLGARYMAILGDDEVAKGVVKLRDMQTKEEWEVPLADAPHTLLDRTRELMREEA